MSTHWIVLLCVLGYLLGVALTLAILRLTVYLEHEEAAALGWPVTAPILLGIFVLHLTLSAGDWLAEWLTRGTDA